MGTTGTIGTTGGRTSDRNTLQWQKSRKAGMCNAWRVVERQDLQTDIYLLGSRASKQPAQALLWRSRFMAMKISCD